MLAYLLVSQMIVSSAPPLPPAQSARILAQVQSPANFSNRFVCIDCGGPYADIIPSRSGDGPFGPFPQYEFSPLGFGSYYGTYFGSVPWWGEGPFVSRIPFGSRGPMWGAARVAPGPFPAPMAGGFANRSRPGTERPPPRR